MQLNYSEKEDLDNTPNYWDVSKTKEPKKKPKFGYDDILSSINLVVKNGVLQYMTPNVSEDNNQGHNQPLLPNTNYRQNIAQSQQQQTQQSQQTQQQKKVTIDPHVKNSAIYNKYFKNYKDHNEVREVKIPKTKEELRQMLIEDHVKRVEAQKRIAQIKPKRMFFFGPETAQTTTPIYASQNHNTFNQLFKFR